MEEGVPEAEKVCVLCYAPWDPIGEQMEQVLVALMPKFPEVQFGKVDVEKKAMSVEAVPTVLFFVKNRIWARVEGSKPPAVAAKLAELVSYVVEDEADLRLKQLTRTSKFTVFLDGTPERCSAESRALLEQVKGLPYAALDMGEVALFVDGVKRDVTEEDLASVDTIVVFGEVPEHLQGRKYTVFPDKEPAVFVNGKRFEGEVPSDLALLTTSKPVMLFMKGNPDAPRCGFSRKTCQLLKDHHVQFDSFDILQDNDVRQGLKTYSNWPTFPQLYVNGDFVGGLDILQEMAQDGPLKPQIGLA